MFFFNFAGRCICSAGAAYASPTGLIIETVLLDLPNTIASFFNIVLHSAEIQHEKKWPAGSTKYSYFNWSTNLRPWKGMCNGWDKIEQGLKSLNPRPISFFVLIAGAKFYFASKFFTFFAYLHIFILCVFVFLYFSVLYFCTFVLFHFFLLYFCTL